MEIDKLKQEFGQEFNQAGSTNALEQLRVKYLGRKGLLTQVLRSLKSLPLEERRKVGTEANQLKEEWEHKIQLKITDLKSDRSDIRPLDVTRPGRKVSLGHIHPLSQALKEIIEIFASMGFSVVEGPEIETEWYNFDALNIPAGHPAREMWDTFWLQKQPKFPISNFQFSNKKGKNLKTSNQQPATSNQFLLRTHTSPVQIRYMQQHNPPLRIIAPGTAYRYEQVDATHGFQFRQVEGLLVDEKVSIANMLAVFEQFFSRFFNRKIKARVRPSYFPFVEPGLEVDIFMDNKWLEMAGAGMVHQNVFRNVGYGANQWAGFAFGFGWERLAMMKYQIPDLRLFYSGDLRFINQF